MRHHTHDLARFLLVLSLLVSAPAFAGMLKPTGHSVAGEVLVKIQNGASGNDIAGIQQSADIDQSERISSTKLGAIYRMHSRSLNTEALTATLEQNPNVVYAEPNYLLHLAATANDPSYGQLYGLKNTGQVISGVPGTAGSDIRAEAAWNVTTGSAAIVVGVG